jgi:hypothetical protein
MKAQRRAASPAPAPRRIRPTRVRFEQVSNKGHLLTYIVRFEEEEQRKKRFGPVFSSPPLASQSRCLYKMAAVASPVQAAAAEAEQDVSLLAMNMDRLAQAGRSLEPTSRIIVLGKLAEGTSAEMFVSMHEQTLGEDVTGLLLMLPSGFAEMVEGPLAALRRVLRMLSSKGLVDNGKVAGFTEDVPARSFSCWSSKALDVQRSNFVEVGKGDAGEEQVAALLADLQIGFLKLGRAVGDKARPAIGAALDKWSTDFSDFMPSNERVNQLTFEDTVLDLSEFMSVYEAPVDLKMSSASVWPADKPLLY